MYFRNILIEKSDMPKFNLALQLDYAVSGPAHFVFNIHPVNTPQQRVTDEGLRIRPTRRYWVETDPELGNRNLRLSAETGSLTIQYETTVEVQHHFEPLLQLQEVPVRRLPPEALRYLYPSPYCQSDLLPRAEVNRFAVLAPGYERVQAICEWVRARTRFQPGATNSATCALDTLRDRVGVCRNFAHLMIAFCRAAGVPARIVTGIDYGADPALGPPDFHAYVEAFLGDRWYIFDPTGMSPTNGLLRIGTGRDAGGVAFAAIFGNVRGGPPIIRIDASEKVPPMPDGNAVSTARSQCLSYTA